MASATPYPCLWFEKDAEEAATFYTSLLPDSRINDVQVVPNVPHQQGGCMAPVQYLAQQGVKQLIAGGMGYRPLMGFNQVGIQVYYSGGLGTVGEAVNALVDGKLTQFSQEHTCGGGAHP